MFARTYIPVPVIFQMLKSPFDVTAMSYAEPPATHVDMAVLAGLHPCGSVVSTVVAPTPAALIAPVITETITICPMRHARTPAEESYHSSGDSESHRAIPA